MDKIASRAFRDMTRLTLTASQALTEVTHSLFQPPSMPPSAKGEAAGLNISGLFETLTPKATFGIGATVVQNQFIPVTERIVWHRPFCRLIRFERPSSHTIRHQPRMLIVAPLSGNFATLLRDTVKAFLPYYDVYITDWADARAVPLAAGTFGLDDYVDYVVDICRHLDSADNDGPLHVLGVCQSTVPVIAAMARMEADEEPSIPASMTLMCGPIDTRHGHTQLYHRIQALGWFCSDTVRTVPHPYPGAGRKVYPGYLQLLNALWVNSERDLNAHMEILRHALEGGGSSLMDLDADYFLQMMDTVFMRHALPRNEMTHRGAPVHLSSIKKTGLMTIEGGRDDICGIGQTSAAHSLCPNIPAERKLHYCQDDVGHYGVFSGQSFRTEIAPRIRAFHDTLTAIA